MNGGIFVHVYVCVRDISMSCVSSTEEHLHAVLHSLNALLESSDHYTGVVMSDTYLDT